MFDQIVIEVAAGVLTASIIGVLVYQIKLYKKIDMFNARLTETEHEISEIKGQMITWNVLKRIELHLSSLPKGEADHHLATALHAEIESRGE